MRKTILAATHEALGARMVDFAGWWMPVHYGSIVAEHHAVRRTAGLFDVSHMGRLIVGGPDAIPWTNRLISNDCAALKVGQARYSLVTNEQGGCLDDILVSRDEDHLFIVCNASNRDAVWEHLQAHLGGADVTIEDAGDRLGMIAFQGPKSLELLAEHTDIDLGALKYYHFVHGRVFGEPATVARTGYTGEDGVELYVEVERTPWLWRKLQALGGGDAVKPCGLGARDTLRLEAGMPLYGHELDEKTTPLEAGLDFAVKLNKTAFLGLDALRRQKEEGVARKLIGLVVESKRIPRQHALLFAGGEKVGAVTSGTASPTLGKNLGMGYVVSDFAKVATALEVEISEKRYPAVVCALPFYQRAK